MKERTKQCETCGSILTDNMPENYPEEDWGGGWWICAKCEKEYLPMWHGFEMYDSVEVVGATWKDGTKVIGTVKGCKGDLVGVSTDGCYMMVKPENLRLIRKLYE